ncbi:hypothetical protein [Roseibium sediminis]|uniref:hypothetical protein n=1 Tax=Roseibium sediminis TaxID=1775174 RepID=UPI001864F9AE|nr:hypothetical protein [Roseibium sediminis]
MRRGLAELNGLHRPGDLIEAWIENTVPADDMEFASQLSVMTDGTKYNLADMTASTKTAHCAQIRRVAKSYRFTD